MVAQSLGSQESGHEFPRSTTRAPKALPAPWPSLPRRFPRPNGGEVLVALSLLYGKERGYAELGVIDGDPGTVRLRAPHNGERWQRFIYIREDTHASLAALYCDLVERYGNMYVSLGLYRCRERTFDELVGIRVLFLDDPARELDELGPPALVLQTSPRSQQHFYVLSQSVDAADYRLLAGGAKVAAGAGDNSSNPLHMVRLPGAVNTKAKYGQPFVGRIVAHDPDTTIDPIAATSLMCGTICLEKRKEYSIGDVGTGHEEWHSQAWRDALKAEAVSLAAICPRRS
jgi:hypothetical protein